MISLVSRQQKVRLSEAAKTADWKNKFVKRYDDPRCRSRARFH